MGIYIFKHRYTNWIRVGNYSKGNPYMRLLRGGFDSTCCPDEIKGYTNYMYMDLLYWFDNLSNEVENLLHGCFFRREKPYGKEWYTIENLENILNFLIGSGGINNCDIIMSPDLYSDFIKTNEYFSSFYYMNLKNWDKFQIGKLLKFYNNGIPIPIIAMYLGRDPNTIYFKLNQILYSESLPSVV